MTEPLRVVATVAKRVNHDSWDRRAAESDASYRGTYLQIKAWSIKHCLQSRVVFFHLRDASNGAFIGQCAVALSSGGGRFIDRLMLLPRYAGHWDAAMRSILLHLPRGTYRYGWELSLEESRAGALTSISGISGVHVRALSVSAVMFDNWASWDEYYDALSTNVRRNIKRAMREMPDLSIRVRRDWAAIAEIPTLIRLRRSMYERKGIGFGRHAAAFNTLVGSMMADSDAFISVATNKGTTLAALRGVSFGRNTYYLEGGSAPNNQGASWYLLAEMLRGAFSTDPAGRFVMGYVDYNMHDESQSGGLLRSRRSCRARDHDTSVVDFDWRPGYSDQRHSGPLPG